MRKFLFTTAIIVLMACANSALAKDTIFNALGRAIGNGVTAVGQGVGKGVTTVTNTLGITKKKTPPPNDFRHRAVVRERPVR